VVQVATRPGAVNRYEYSATATATAAPPPPSSPCGAVQSGPSNLAKVSITAGTSQSCTIVQNATGTGTNTVQLAETIQQGVGASQTASQDARVTQTSEMGSNSAQISQKITQSISESGTSVNESQGSDQTYSVNQNVTQSTPAVGTNSSRADQTLTQTETATNATSGSQYQRANLTGHVDQFSHALSTSQNNQTESQTETAVRNSAVSQTQIGPTRCCTSQGDNVKDVFKARQTLSQTNNSANTSSSEDARITLVTSGSATGNQTVTENGNTTSNSFTGHFVSLSTECTGTDCTPTQGGSGDVFVSVSDGKVQEWNVSGPTPALVRTLDTGRGGETTGLAFDSALNLYVTAFTANDVVKFDPSGSVVGSFGSGYNAAPESILFDASGNAYVGQADGSGDVLKFDAGGGSLGLFDVLTGPRGSDHIALAADGCTLYYTSEGSSVRRFNVCTNTQLTDFATGVGCVPTCATAYGIRLLPDGGALVADSDAIRRLNSSGTVTQTYDAIGDDLWFSLALDPGGTAFWAGDGATGDVYKFDLATGSVLKNFNTGVESFGVRAGGIAIAP
jgi:hypothetical protein